MTANEDALRQSSGKFSVKAFWNRQWRNLSSGTWIESLAGAQPHDGDEAVIQSFMPSAEAIEEAPVPISAHASLYAVLTLLLLAIIWAIFGKIDRVVVAQGKIATRTPMIVMQPFTTSRIVKLHVKPGDHVGKGQSLASFDPAFAQADVASLESKVRSLTATIERIDAQLSGSKFAASQRDTAERQTQAQIFTQEMSAYAAEMRERDNRIGGIQSQEKADNANIAQMHEQLAMANKVVGIRQYLLEQKAGAPLDVMTAKSTAIDIEVRLQNTVGEAQKLAQQRAEIEAERRSYLDKWHSDHNQQLVQSRQDLAEARETLNKAHRMQDLTELRAPADSVVLEIADRSVGSVLREAETLITLVPDGANLYVEANVPSRDIGYLKVGDPVRIKLETYPFQRYGTLEGRLDNLSADSVPLKQGDQTELVYHAQVGIHESARELVARGISIRPGMVASAEIRTGKRSIASYITEPVLRTTDESLREP